MIGRISLLINFATHIISRNHAPTQEITIVEEHIRGLERRFLATLTRTPPETKGSADKANSNEWIGSTWKERKQNEKTKDSNGELTMLGVQRLVLPLFLTIRHFFSLVLASISTMPCISLVVACPLLRSMTRLATFCDQELGLLL